MSIAPNPVEPPSPANGYRIPERAHATADLFNLIFGSIGARLDAAETKSADYDAAIDRIIGQALETVSAALTVEIEAGRLKLEEVQQAFEELQSGGFSASRIAATLAGQAGVTDAQQALSRLLQLVGDVGARFPDIGASDALKFVRARGDRAGFELAEVDLYSASLMLRRQRISNVQIGRTDKGALIDITSGTFTQTFASAATLGNGWYGYVRNGGTGNITIPSSDARTNWVMYPGEVRLFLCDGATLRSIVLVPFYVVFLASGAFIKPPGYPSFQAYVMGGSGGGGGGSYRAGSSNTGGGSAGQVSTIIGIPRIPASTINNSETVTVGALGAAGANATGSTSAPGTAGQPGGATSFAGVVSPGGLGGLPGTPDQSGAAASRPGTGSAITGRLGLQSEVPATAPGRTVSSSTPPAASLGHVNGDAVFLVGISQFGGDGGDGRNDLTPTPVRIPGAGSPGAVAIQGVL